MILQLQALEMHPHLLLHEIHIVGTGMQWQGMDGLSGGSWSSVHHASGWATHILNCGLLAFTFPNNASIILDPKGLSIGEVA
jgi:hypothetical protein